MRSLAVEDEDGLLPVDLAYKSKKFSTFGYLLSEMPLDTKLDAFGRRIHEYCEKSILEKRRLVPIFLFKYASLLLFTKLNLTPFLVMFSTFRDVFEAVIRSPWFSVAFNGFYCANLHEAHYGLKPCQSFARLAKCFPEVACELMDKHISKPTHHSNKEIHNFTPLEFVYYNKNGTFTKHSFI